MKAVVVKIAFALLFFVLAFTPEARSQKNLNKLISVSVEKKELGQVLSLIQSQTGIRFTYSSDVVDVHQKISCHLIQQKLEDFLETELKPLGINYRVIDEGQILLFVPAGKKQDARASLPFDEVLLFFVSAQVTDVNGEPLPGVTVIEKGTSNGTVTDEKGMYRLRVHQNAVLVFSLIGYVAKELKAGYVKMFNVTLQKDIKPIDEVIVTGVFDKRKRIESAVAITTLNASDIAARNPVSAADYLTNVPGVYVNSSLGEIRNVVYSRGVSANSTDAASGYYYVSLQEDGLPVTNVTFRNFGPDYFYRPDASFKRLEAVRGGTASILGANAPGGIFNYISQTGGETFAGLVKTKFGIEGGRNPYYRADINVGGPVNDKGWFFHAGGFYRYSQGARYPGYPLNYGGQFKGNISRQFKNGVLKFYAKYLNDHNGWFEFLPAKNFDQPRLIKSVRATDSYLLPRKNTTFPFAGNSEMRTFDPTVLAHSKEIAFGQSIEFRFKKGWTINNNGKYSQKKHDWQSSSLVYPFSINNRFLYSSIGLAGRAGTFTFKDRSTGEIMAQVHSPNGSHYNVISSKLPSMEVVKNGVLRNVGLYFNTEVQEWIDQFSVTKKIQNMSFTGGVYYAHSRVKNKGGSPGIGLSAVENRPQLLSITLEDSTGRVFQVTNPDGYSYQGVGYTSIQAGQSDWALFLGHTWILNKKWTLDWGARLGVFSVKGNNNYGVVNKQAGDSHFGGKDGNPATMYDNLYFVPGTANHYNKSIHTTSYSAGLNYKVNNQLAVYGRYAHGEKAPDLTFYFAQDTKEKTENIRPRAQKVDQVEVGLMAFSKKYKFFFTPFFSRLSNVYILDVLLNAGGNTYFTPPLLNSVQTFGVEAEVEYIFSNRLKVRSVATVQTARTKNWEVWVAHEPGQQDDELVNYSGKKADNNPDVMLQVTPSYKTGKFDALLSWRYMGSRPGNVPNTITLPGFSQFDVGIRYCMNKRLGAEASINNLFNSEGVMSWSAPLERGRPLDRQGFTRQVRDANPNATFGIITIQPRAYFFTLTYKI